MGRLENCRKKAIDRLNAKFEDDMNDEESSAQYDIELSHIEAGYEDEGNHAYEVERDRE